MNRYTVQMFLAAIVLLAPFITNSQERNLTKYVNPFIGTGAVDKNSLSGSNFPGATVPFGFVQLSPDTRREPEEPASGYDYNDTKIVGFSHTHLSGTGVADLFDILFLPVSGNKDKPYESSFSHNQEQAKAGYYQVKLLDYDVNAELTATEHTGFHRYTYPEKQNAKLLIDLGHSLSKKRNYWQCQIIESNIRIVDNYTIEGYRILTGWAKLRKVFFRAEFLEPIANIELYDGNTIRKDAKIINGTNLKALASFKLSAQKPLLVKVGLSAVSIENARLNLQQENPDWNFDAKVQEADRKWEKELNKVLVEGTQEQKEIYYTGLYHAFIQPNNIADVNGEYQATDFSIQKAIDNKHYSTFSLWDTYRAAHPLYTLLQEERTAGFINSMIRQYETYGYLPIWQLWGEENYCMIGNHAIPVIVDAALKGIKGFDLNKAYNAVRASSITDHPGSPFSSWDKYKYIPENIQSQSVSITLEMAYDDWCVSQFAKLLGEEDDFKYFLERSQRYRNLYDNSTGFFRAKNTEGKWIDPFNPLQYGGNGGNPYTEGNAWQYFWYVPQDIKGLISLVGGNKAFTAKLDKFFTLNALPEEVNGNASGFIGQYAHGNEPSHHAAYLYNYAGQPWKTQGYVAKVLNTLYNNSSSGYSGNEDCGQMSAWYIFSAMGFYPVNPANGSYQIGSPVLKKAKIQLANGRSFTVTAANVSPINTYIQMIKLNGKPYNQISITHKQIVSGGTLEFIMGSTPNKKWGMEKE
ncbi:GH92 family glycosyl hydrolase [Desertivirga brevis]|uniref:GH92 family glycosyl hydrolase n=1 Tax=Desertivirga brevis TaxID=2810310 RepID=UPI001F6134FE|nr:GH92 family glycosyl hydrolase [Pedobacter sp. SYSU D00873]